MRILIADPKARQQLIRLIPFLQLSLTFLDRLNKCIFYYRGVFLHLAKRLSRVAYLRQGNAQPRASFR
jgi:hypothetical protein